jgi:ribokinase
MRVAVVGHVEWVEFALVDHIPAPGEVVHALETFCEPAGGGAVAAVQLARLAGEATLFTAFGDDELGDRSRERLEALGVRVRAATRAEPTRRALTMIDATGERTITTLGARLAAEGSDALNWDKIEDFDAVYFTAGDAAALAAARRARVLVASPRARGAITAGAEQLDALVLSTSDPLERGWAAELSVPPRLTVLTDGAAGGTWRRRSDPGGDGARASTGAWSAEPLPGPVVDSYGCGDSFAAALTFALGRGDPLPAALRLAARCGAACLTRRGPYGPAARIGQASSRT